MSFKILDSFCGIGRWAKRDIITPSTVDEVVAQLDRFGISRALVYSNRIRQLSQADECNQTLVEMINNNERLIPAFSLALNPYEADNGVDSCFGLMRDAKARALWINSPFASKKLTHSLRRWQLGEWLDRCSKAKLPVLLYAEGLPPDNIDTLCREFPDLKVILTSVMYSGDSFLYPLLRAHPNLYVSLGHMYIPAGNPELFVRHHGYKRLIFGSGLPDFSPGGMITHVMYADISDTAKSAIFSDNLATLLNEVEL